MRIIRTFYIEGRAPIVGGFPVSLDAVRRLLSRKPADPCGCWHFGIPRIGPASQYAKIPFKTKDGRKLSMPVHRLSYLWFTGQIPDGLMVLHRCNNKSCFNPAHLYAGDDFDNARDRAAYERSEAAAGRITRGAAWRAQLMASAARRRAAMACEAVAA